MTYFSLMSSTITSFNQNVKLATMSKPEAVTLARTITGLGGQHSDHCATAAQVMAALHYHSIENCYSQHKIYIAIHEFCHIGIYQTN